MEAAASLPYPSSMSLAAENPYETVSLFGLANKLEDIRNGLAQGKAAQGAREQGRDASRPQGRSDAAAVGVLEGHWHKEYRGTYTNLYVPAYKNETSCLAFIEGRGLDCPYRDPRSTS